MNTEEAVVDQPTYDFCWSCGKRHCGAENGKHYCESCAFCSSCGNRRPGHHEPLRSDLIPVRDLLFSAGGDRSQEAWFVNENVPPVMVKTLLTFGTFFPATTQFKCMAANVPCDENAKRLAGEHQHYRAFIGFALSDDGCWRLHSWVQTPSGLIETTGWRRTLYFGVPLPPSRPATTGSVVGS